MALALPLAVSACGTKQTLEQAVKCDDFKRLGDGRWAARTDVSLDYLSNGIEHQVNLSKGAGVDGLAREEPELLPMLERKCAPGR